MTKSNDLNEVVVERLLNKVANLKAKNIQFQRNIDALNKRVTKLEKQSDKKDGLLNVVEKLLKQVVK